MSTFAQTTLVRYARWGLVAASIAVTAACGGGGGGGGGTPSTPANMANAASVTSGSIDLVLNANRVNGVAPLAVSFNSIGTTADAALTARPFHELSYKWEFSDTSDTPDWAYGATSSNRKKNVAYGPVAGHIFEKSGTWTVTLTATASSDKSIQVSKTITVQVTDPASLNTICVSNTGLPVGGVAGCPVGAAGQLVTSWAGIAGLAATYKRILLKRGDVWNSDGHISLGSQHVGGIIDAYGVGSVKPKVVLVSDNAGFYLNGTTDWRISNIEIAGNAIVGPTKSGVSIAGGGGILVSNVEVSNGFIGIGSDGVDGLTISECYVHDMYASGTGVHGIAAYIANTDNLSILGSKFNDIPGNHVARIQGTEKTVIANNIFQSASTNGNALTVRGKSTGATSTWNGLWTQYVVVSNNVIDNSIRGGYAFYSGPQSVNHAERVKDLILDGNDIRGRMLQAANFQVASGLTVRNNIFISHNGHIVGFGLGGNTAGSPSTDGVYVYNNNFYKPDISQTAGFSAMSLWNANLAANVFLKNNIIYGPGNIKDGAGNGSHPTLLTQGGVLGVEGVNFFQSGNSSESDISNTRPWLLQLPAVAQDFRPTSSYASSNRYPSFYVNWDMTMLLLSSSRVRGALEP